MITIMVWIMADDKILTVNPSGWTRRNDIQREMS